MKFKRFLSKNNHSGSVAVVLAICLIPVVIGILALTIDLGKNQSESIDTAGSVDAASSSTAQFVEQSRLSWAVAHPTSSNWQSQGLTDNATLTKYAYNIMLQNQRDQSVSTVIPPATDPSSCKIGNPNHEFCATYSYDTKTDSSFVTVSGCAHVNNNPLAKAAGYNSDQFVCSKRESAVLCQQIVKKRVIDCYGKIWPDVDTSTVPGQLQTKTFTCSGHGPWTNVGSPVVQCAPFVTQTACPVGIHEANFIGNYGGDLGANGTGTGFVPFYTPSQDQILSAPNYSPAFAHAFVTALQTNNLLPLLKYNFDYDANGVAHKNITIDGSSNEQVAITGSYEVDIDDTSNLSGGAHMGAGQNQERSKSVDLSIPQTLKSGQPVHCDQSCTLKAVGTGNTFNDALNDATSKITSVANSSTIPNAQKGLVSAKALLQKLPTVKPGEDNDTLPSWIGQDKHANYYNTSTYDASASNYGTITNVSVAKDPTSGNITSYSITIRTSTCPYSAN